LRSTRVAGGLNLPVYVTHAPGDFARLFIVEKPGRIRILDLLTGQLRQGLFLDIDALVGGTHEPFTDPGLLGMTFHPDYAVNGYFYVHYLNNQTDTVVARYRVSSDPDVANPSSGRIIFTLDQPHPNHNGGWIGFGPDGFLYVPLGDGGSQNDPDDRAQDLEDLHGKILRIDVDRDDFPEDADRNYAIPADNPFVGAPGADEIWAYGLRNPWRCSFDALRGDLWIADVGQFEYEEINVQPANATGGENYGWRCFEGNELFNPKGCGTSKEMKFPLHVYDHGPEGGRSIIGGYVYRGCEIPSARGRYFFADFVTDHIWSLTRVGDEADEIIEHDGELLVSIEGHVIDWIASFGTDALGELYVVEQGMGTDGEVFRIVPQEASVAAADLDCDGDVSGTDVALLVESWGPCPGCRADLDGNLRVGIVDLLILLASW
jgi:glucose/arabinose dehydrogenase